MLIPFPPLGWLSTVLAFSGGIYYLKLKSLTGVNKALYQARVDAGLNPW